jgi:TrmH family RNA methyltransferase
MTGWSLDIESTANPRVKAWVSLSNRAGRDSNRAFLIEGARETERARGRVRVREIIWCPEYGVQPEAGHVQFTIVSKRVFDKISRRQNPDGVAAVAETPDMSLASFAQSTPSLVLIADAIEKPGNLGAMLRSCDAFGAGLIGSSLGTDLVNPNVIRSAQGSFFTTPIASASRRECVEWAIDHTRIIVAHPTAGVSLLWEQDMRGPTSIVIGSEHAGVDPQWLEVGVATSIPMGGIADSLNASVSAGVFLAEVARQRSG